MWLIGVSLVLGIVLGLTCKLSENGYNLVNKVTTVALFAMLFVLGAQIGSRQELLTNIPILGSKALIIAVCSVIGSIGVLWAVVRWFRIDSRQEDING